MTFVEVLRTLFSPLTVQALRAGADALEEQPKLLATIAGLEATVAWQADRIRELTPEET